MPCSLRAPILPSQLHSYSLTTEQGGSAASLPVCALMGGVTQLNGHSPSTDLSASLPHSFLYIPGLLLHYSLFPLFSLHSPLLRDLILILVSLMTCL